MQRIVLFLTLLISLQASADDAPWLAEARKVASTVPPKLLQVLEAEIAMQAAAKALTGSLQRSTTLHQPS